MTSGGGGAARIVLEQRGARAPADEQRILKRRCEVGGRREHPERSLAYYRAGPSQGLGDGGYTAINTAFILDQLAALA